MAGLDPAMRAFRGAPHRPQRVKINAGWYKIEERSYFFEKK
jgi:hypothetical protein